MNTVLYAVGFVAGLWLLNATGQWLWDSVSPERSLEAWLALRDATAAESFFDSFEKEAAASLAYWINRAAALAVVVVLTRWAIVFVPLAQRTLVASYAGPVDPLFPRRWFWQAHAKARERRDKIDAYLDRKVVPAPTRSSKLASVRKTREEVDRLVEEDLTERRPVPAFLEYPEGAGRVKTPELEGPEEIVGQFVRLSLERQQPSLRIFKLIHLLWQYFLARAFGFDMPEHERRTARRQLRLFWSRVTGFQRHEETIMLLLARVVDAAIVVDMNLDAERDDQRWRAMPFYDRIYAEYTPLPFLVRHALCLFTGAPFEARVVIETRFDYESAFRTSFEKRGRQFGVGIEIRKPAAGLSRRPWNRAAVDALCRRLKSHMTGVLSGKIEVRYRQPPPAGSTAAPPERVEGIHIMPSGPLADGCPSVVRPAASPPPPSPARDEVNVEKPLLARGAVSNAPPIWPFPVKGRLNPDCQERCLRRQSEAVAQTMLIDFAVQEVEVRASLLPRRICGPRAAFLYRRVWSGVFFDPDLSLANRFPVFGCSFLLRERDWIDPDRYQDLRGAFAAPQRIWPAWLMRAFKRNPFGGVFVSERGPRHGAHLLLPEQLLNDYLKHLARRAAVFARMPEAKEKSIIPPKPQAR